MEISKRRKIRGLEEWKIGKGNGKRQGRDTRQRHSSITEGQTRRWIATPTISARNDGQYGFTLVELVIVIAIVIVLSVVSVPIYRSYVDKAKMSEGYALLGTILSAQKAYYSEYGNFLKGSNWSVGTINTVLGIDIRGNKYFTAFGIGNISGDPKTMFAAYIRKPIDLGTSTCIDLSLSYNLTSGATIFENNW